MATLTAFIVVLAMLAASLGWGLAVLRARSTLSVSEHLVWALILGMGVQGWLMFPAALTLGASRETAGLIAAGGLICLLVLYRGLAPTKDRPRPVDSPPPGWLAWFLAIVLAATALMDLAAGLVPPADADSMAYHFALPKRYLAVGRIEFLPQAVEAAIPLLLHMTYMQALALGGEAGMTLWCAASAWLLPLGAFVAVRRYVALEWALVLAILVKSTPAVVYGSPSGQIEVRLAAMFLAAVFLAARARSVNAWPLAAAAGLVAGFCAGAKYSGLVAISVCGLTMLGSLDKWRRILAFGLAALLAGCQWYLWNWFNTGDPVFPLLWGVVPYKAMAHWDADMARTFALTIQGEASVPRNLAWLFLYPWKATFDGLSAFDAGRTGLGPLPVLLLPFALAGWWPYRRRSGNAEPAMVLALCVLGYGLWYLGGSSQRVRHFLPELIPLLVLMLAAASRCILSLRRPLIAGLAAVVCIQLAGHGIYSIYNVRYAIGDETRAAYLRYNISAYPIAEWINSNLRGNDRVLMSQRELIYHMDVPVHYAAPLVDGRVKIFPSTPDAGILLGQLRVHGVTHLIANIPKDDGEEETFIAMVKQLMAAGCIHTEKMIYVPPMLMSRTLRISSNVKPIGYSIMSTNYRCGI